MGPCDQAGIKTALTISEYGIGAQSKSTGPRHGARMLGVRHRLRRGVTTSLSLGLGEKALVVGGARAEGHSPSCPRMKYSSMASGSVDEVCCPVLRFTKVW